MLIAQISDFHLGVEERLTAPGLDTASALEAAVAHLAGLARRPDVVIVTGDIADNGLDAEYALARRHLALLGVPVYVVPGNRDRRPALVRAFGADGYLPEQGFLNYVIEDRPIRLIGLDTQDEGRAGGLLCAERLAWLEEVLRAEPERPTALFMHHPPFATGIDYNDRGGFQGAEALAQLLRHYRQVEAVFAGHVHRPIHGRWQGAAAITVPSVAYQVGLDLREKSSSAVTLEPPAAMMHLWHPEQGLVSHLSFIGAYAGPFKLTRVPPRADAA